MKFPKHNICSEEKVTKYVYPLLVTIPGINVESQTVDQASIAKINFFHKQSENPIATKLDLYFATALNFGKLMAL